MMKTKIISNFQFPAIGQGGWNLGDNIASQQQEIDTLCTGIELGMNLIDSAEMYGDGRSEELIARALQNIPRSSYQLVSKVYPHNAGEKNLQKHCEASLRRLNADYLDIYLLHWRGEIPLEETVYGMQSLVKEGKIRRWGVSNFDTSDMEELWNTPGGKNCLANQVLYHLGSRGIEYDLIPWMHQHDMMVMAYCPLAQAGQLKRTKEDFLTNLTLQAIAQKYDISVLQLMLAFSIRLSNVMAIPKSSRVEHVLANAKASEVSITEEDWKEIDTVFWPPTEKMHLDIE